MHQRARRNRRDVAPFFPQPGREGRDRVDLRQTEPDEYEQQLAQITDRLLETGATLVFATTTPYPDGVKPRRDPADAARYNEIARRVMAARGVAINDLYAFAEPRLAKLQQPVNVHFSPRGSRALGNQVIRAVREAARARQK